MSAQAVQVKVHRVVRAEREQAELSVAYFYNSKQLDFIPDNAESDTETKLTTFIDSLLPYVDFSNVDVNRICQEIHKHPLDRAVIIQHDNMLECYLFE
jgi:hypothetical protein